MAASSFPLWLAWAAFGLAAVLVTARLLQAALRTPVPERALPREPEQAWLYCEEGSPLDLEVRWFRVRPGGTTVLGSRPRSATADTSYLYLNSHDIAEDHALIRYDATSDCYRVQPPGGGLHHNNEPLSPGQEAVLTDGDTLELGATTRFRYTLTGPAENGG